MALNMPLLEQSFELVAPTEAAKQACVNECYATLLRLHPKVEQLFAHTNIGEQARKLMATLTLVLHALKKPDVLMSTSQRLGRRHQEVRVRAEHYPMVAEARLSTFASRLVEQWTVEMQAAWTEAYEAIVGLISLGDTSSAVFTSLIVLRFNSSSKFRISCCPSIDLYSVIATLL